MSSCNHYGMTRTSAPFAALLIAVLSFSLLQTMPVPTLPTLQAAFGTSTTTVSWVLSAFLLTASVATGLLGRLGDMFGKRRGLLACLAVIGLFAAAVALLAVFTLVEKRRAQPLIDIGLLGHRAVLTSNITALIIGFGMYGAFTLVPLLVQTPSRAGYGFGASVTEAGLFIIPMAVTMLFASPLAGRIGARTGFKMPLVLACVLGAAGFVVFAVAHDTPWTVYAGNGIIGIGVGFAFAALANLVVAAVDPRQTGEATGVNTIMRTIGGTFGAQIASTIVAGEFIAGTRFPVESGYTTAFVLSAIAMGVAALVALAGPGRHAPAAATAPRTAAVSR